MKKQIKIFLVFLLIILVFVGCKNKSSSPVYEDMESKLEALEDENTLLLEKNEDNLSRIEALKAESSKLNEEIEEAKSQQAVKSPDEYSEDEKQLVLYNLKVQADGFYEFIKPINEQPFYRIKSDEDIEYIKLANEWFYETNEDPNLKLIALGYVMKTDFDDKLIVEGLVYNTTAFDGLKTLSSPGVTLFRYVQFRLLKKDDNWIIDEYIDEF